MTNSARRILFGFAAGLAALFTPVAFANWGDLNMSPGVTAISQEIYSLHMRIFWWCTGIAVVVFGVMIVSLVRFRRSQGAVADTKMLHSTKAEIIWTVVPVVILVVLAVPAAKTLIAIEDTRNTELTIRVTGYQWKWEFDYLDDGIDYFSMLDHKSNEARQLQSGIDPNSVENYLLSVDNPLVVPDDTKVRLLLTSQDVIHAWWVPAFGMKKDAIPGFINEMWFKVDKGKTGIYRGQCAELCGRDHGFMPLVVRVLSKADYAVWVKQQQDAAKPAAAAPAAAPADAAPAAVPAQAAAPVAAPVRG
jgi:cytochrome c oxidase subunit 2